VNSRAYLGGAKDKERVGDTDVRNRCAYITNTPGENKKETDLWGGRGDGNKLKNRAETKGTEWDKVLRLQYSDRSGEKKWVKGWGLRCARGLQAYNIS